MSLQPDPRSHDPNAAKAVFSVLIVACGPTQDGLVCAIHVQQPVQSWTVFRCSEDFRAMGDVLASVLPILPMCPTPVGNIQLDVHAMIKLRDELQEWLTAILMYPGARESVAVRNFLTCGANMIPPQYEGISWTQFSPLVAAPTRPAVTTGMSNAYGVHSQVMSNLDDMDMDELFMGGDDAFIPNDDHDDDEDYVPTASVRYKPTEEAVTDADEMEILDLAGEVEMVEDVGSLAQSMGASHLGRSLQLQAEMRRGGGTGTMGVGMSSMNHHQQQGLKIIPPTHPRTSVGGIGGAITRAQNESNTNTAFYQKPIQSAPRLDSFKLIKVIGKGSFGTSNLISRILPRC